MVTIRNVIWENSSLLLSLLMPYYGSRYLSKNRVRFFHITILYMPGSASPLPHSTRKRNYKCRLIYLLCKCA